MKVPLWSRCGTPDRSFPGTHEISLESELPGLLHTKNNLSQLLKNTCLSENGKNHRYYAIKSFFQEKSINYYGGSYSIESGEMEVE